MSRVRLRPAMGGDPRVQNADYGVGVAVKVLEPELAAVRGADRFVQEIENTANLQYPHILPPCVPRSPPPGQRAPRNLGVAVAPAVYFEPCSAPSLVIFVSSRSGFMRYTSSHADQRAHRSNSVSFVAGPWSSNG